MGDLNEHDYLKGDHSFRMWFKIMWKNWYIQIFIIALSFAASILRFYGERDTGFYVAMSIPIGVLLVIAYKGLYQFWNDLKNNSSR